MSAVELTPNDVLELKLLKDHLAQRLAAARSNSLDVTGRRLASDEIRSLEKWIETIQRILVRAMKGTTT